MHNNIRENINCLFLPDYCAIFNEKRLMLPIESLTDIHLPQIMPILSVTSKNMQQQRCKVIALHIDKINLKSNYAFVNKRLLLDSSYNHPNKLVNNMLIFLILSASNYLKPINIGAIPECTLN